MRLDLEPGIGSVPSDVSVTLNKILDDCDKKAQITKVRFERVISSEKDRWEERYANVIRRLGKGNEVETLMGTLAQDVQLLVNSFANVGK